MTIDIQPAGSEFQYPRYVWERPKRGLSGTITRMFGGARNATRLAGVERVVSPFPFALLPGAEAEEALSELASLRPDCTPIIFGKPETAAGMLDLRQEESYESLLASLDTLDLRRWLADRSAELEQIGIQPPRGAWPTENHPESGLYCVRRIQAPRDFEPEMVIGLVPASEPALVPLRLGYGNWNDCPAPVIHAALARRWNVLCGAIPVAFAGDVVEYRVAHPIASREMAITVALEQFAYCPDIVLQGTETIERLAASLLEARYWFFWWD
jgi:hypothetical protein